MPFLRVRQAEGAHLCAVRSTDRRVARRHADPAFGLQCRKAKAGARPKYKKTRFRGLVKSFFRRTYFAAAVESVAAAAG
jgi:hypothetical protein